MTSFIAQNYEAPPLVSPWLLYESPKVVRLVGSLYDQKGWEIPFKPEIDNGCQITCIYPRVVTKNCLQWIPLPQPIPMSNANGSRNCQWEAMHVIRFQLKIRKHSEVMEALILDIGKNNMLLGQDWLAMHNPSVNWCSRWVVFDRCPNKCWVRLKKVPVLQVKAPELDENGLLKGKQPGYIAPFVHMFEKKNFNKLPGWREWDHEIKLTDDAPKDLPAQNYWMMPIEAKVLDEFLDAELAVEKIHPSNSPYAAPCFFIVKKDTGWQLVQDYQKVNKFTVKDKTPLPRIDNLLDMLLKGKIYTMVDIICGYNNIRIKEGNEWKAAFLMPQGLFEPTIMYFGLCNSPSTFMRMMVTIFWKMIHDWKCVIYMDDIIFCGKDKDKLCQNTIEGLRILKQHDLYVKESKCYWEVEEVPVLGDIVGHSCTCMEWGKVQTILDWKMLMNKNNVHVFNGFCNFYRRYIPAYLKVAKLLTRLLGNVPFEWSLMEQQAFEGLKTLIVSEQVVAHLLPDRPYWVEVDASGQGLGGVLPQKHPDSKWCMVVFISWVMSPAELNYNIYDKELLAIMFALDEWHPYLLHTTSPFKIWTDHQNLLYFRQPQKLNGHQACWYARLQEYDYKLKHIPGALNSKADILSQLPWYKNALPPNDNVVVLPEKWFAKQVSIETILFKDDQFSGGGVTHPVSCKTTQVVLWTSIDAQIQACKQKDPHVEWLKMEHPHLFSLNDGLLLHEGHVYIPPDAILHSDILHDNHDRSVVGHPGIFKINELIGWQYWWPMMLTDVKKYVKGCNTCQWNKASWQAKANPLWPHDTPMEPWQDILADLIGLIPKSRGFNVILAVINRFSKMIQLIPCTMELTALGLVELYRDNIWKLHGLPQRLTSNREALSLPLSSWSPYTLLLVWNKTYWLPIIHRPTDMWNERIRRWKCSYDTMSIIYKQIGQTSWLSQNINITTNSIPWRITPPSIWTMDGTPGKVKYSWLKVLTLWRTNL